MWEDATKAVTESSDASSIYVGCDSIRFSTGKHEKSWFTRYSTVVVIHIDSKHGGRIFYETCVEDAHTQDNIMHRMLKETELALDAARVIDKVRGNRHMEVHLDINTDPKFKSEKAATVAAGWIAGEGFVSRLKPDGWAATHAADHCVRLGKK